MPSDPPGCPDCHCPLRNDTSSPNRFSCPTCAGTLEGFYPFRGALADGVGQHLWVAAAEGEEIAACPYCSRPMRAPGAGGPDAPEGLGICRPCEQVWIPASAAPWLTRHSAGGQPAPGQALDQPGECPNCGAPYDPDPSGRCRYCRARLTVAPAPVILVEQPEPISRGGLWDLLYRPL